MSRYFDISELLRSQYAARNGIDMTPPAAVRLELERLMSSVLDPIREAWGSAIIVDSGYRPPSVNANVGGDQRSDHLVGRAADIVPTHGDVDALMGMIRGISDHIPLHKAIIEFGSWVHVSIEAEGSAPLRQFLTASRAADGITQYFPWRRADNEPGSMVA